MLSITRVGKESGIETQCPVTSYKFKAYGFCAEYVKARSDLWKCVKSAKIEVSRNHESQNRGLKQTNLKIRGLN